MQIGGKLLYTSGRHCVEFYIIHVSFRPIVSLLCSSQVLMQNLQKLVSVEPQILKILNHFHFLLEGLRVRTSHKGLEGFSPFPALFQCIVA